MLVEWMAGCRGMRSYGRQNVPYAQAAAVTTL
jgi:hypothetical protein